MRRIGQNSLLANHDFRLLWISDTASQFGFFISSTTIPLLAIAVLAATPFEMGVLTAAETIAFLVVGLPAGVWVDRIRRRRLMIVMDLIRATLILSVPLAWLLGLLTFLQLVIVVTLVGAATVFFDVAYQSYLPTLISRDHLAEGNGKLQASQSTGQALGPGIGGLAVRVFGVGNAVAFTGVAYLFSAYSLSKIKAESEVKAGPENKAGLENKASKSPLAIPPDRSLRREILEGLNFVFRDRYVRPIVLCSTTTSFFNSMVLAMEVLFLSKELRLSDVSVGIALGVTGLGAVLGAVTARWWMMKVGSVRAIWLVPILTWPLHVLFPLAWPGWLTFVGIAGAATFCYGAVIYNVASVTFRQQVCPQRLLGRMNGSVRFLVWGIMPLGALCGGIIAQRYGIRPSLLLGTIGILAGIPCLLFSQLRKLKETPSTESFEEATEV